MIIAYTPVDGSGPLRIIFAERDLLTLTATECPEEVGVYWLDGGEVVAIEFDRVRASGDSLRMTVPETKDSFEVTIGDGHLSFARAARGRES